jgi:hypothetical protein
MAQLPPVDFEDSEYTWPPGALHLERRLTGPEMTAQRIEVLERRLIDAEVEINRLREELEYKRRNDAP